MFLVVSQSDVHFGFKHPFFYVPDRAPRKKFSTLIMKNCIFIKTKLIQKYFKDFPVTRNSLQFFDDWANTYLTEYLLMAASVCSSFINFRTALLLEQKKEHSPP